MPIPHAILYRVYGPGQAWGDLDGDGWLDLVTVGGADPSHVWANAAGTLQASPLSAQLAPYLDTAGVTMPDYDNELRSAMICSICASVNPSSFARLMKRTRRRASRVSRGIHHGNRHAGHALVAACVQRPLPGSGAPQASSSELAPLRAPFRFLPKSTSAPSVSEDPREAIRGPS